MTEPIKRPVGSILEAEITIGQHDELDRFQYIYWRTVHAEIRIEGEVNR